MLKKENEKLFGQPTSLIGCARVQLPASLELSAHVHLLHGVFTEYSGYQEKH